MTATATRPLTVAAAVSALQELRGRATDAEAKRDAARAEAQAIEASAGADLLDSDDPDAAERLAQRLGSLRATVELQDRAATEAHSRSRSAAGDALRAEAESLEPDLAEARSELAAFDAKTERLLAAVARHTGCAAEVVDPFLKQADDLRAGHISSIEYDTPKRWGLSDRVEALETRIGFTRALAGIADGSRTIGDVRAEFAIIGDPRAAKWDAVPGLVRDGVVVIDGLWLTSPPSVQ